MKKCLAFVLFNLLISFSQINKAGASEVIINTFIGQKTGIKHPITVTLPKGYNTKQRYRVIYVLHGFSGNHADWTTNTNIEALADRYNVIIVNPDGGYDSWYMNSAINSESRYESYIAHDVVKYIDQKFSTKPTRNGRGITGLSMGGFGALHIAINHQDIFGAVGAMSAGVDLRPFAASFGINKVLGNYQENPTLWDAVAIKSNLYKIAATNNLWQKDDNKLPILLDVGVSDFFLSVNRQLHQSMLELNIEHDYIERPGGHDWDYWRNAITYQFQFLSDNLQ
ncbi:alpha/beta hydrolase family protein [Psychrobium sp. 1_MG-2023]|uniref:alpha/beta hydrolase n=1 Tax=Psychrobium sp. 1_MG-2023 TaxID=3062624 RepID=UPI000C31C56B|nr:alpha/beta hydrolase family protein [Psychrobium sp. 1_MG-2023]MDP2561620.1 alpha/beta hydrolase family protein [Psychrobium sp. 1_MG-2023]PKF55639.1 XynC protein [Alteromonadales bacterium alter-6D02]